MRAFDLLVMVIVVQLFFSVGISIFNFTIPSYASNISQPFSDQADKMDLNKASGIVESSYKSQLGIPAISDAILTFRSGILFVDLIGNFIFAIPEMVGLVSTVLFFILLPTLQPQVAGIANFFIVVLSTVVYVAMITLLIVQIVTRSNVQLV